MRVTTTALAFATAITVPLLAGCAGTSNSEAPAVTTPPGATVGSSGPSNGFGQWKFVFHGAIGICDIPTKADDPRVATLESYRVLADAPAVNYVACVVGNSGGSEGINMYQLTVVTPDGEQITSEYFDDVISGWQDAFNYNTADGSDNYNLGVDIVNSFNEFLRPGATGTFVLVMPRRIPGVSRVYVEPAGGFEEVEAERYAAPPGG